MHTEYQSSASSHFALYELVRIIVPGIYFSFLLMIFLVSFSFQIFPFDSMEAALPSYLMTAVLSGLGFYAKDTPKHRKAFLENQPSRYLLQRARALHPSSVIDEDDARRLYFYILNQFIPSGFHNKIFYFGTLYQVMINLRRTSFWFGILGAGLIIIRFVQTGRLFADQITPVLVVWFIYGLFVYYNKADRKMQDNYGDQIFWLSMNATLVDSLINQLQSLTQTTVTHPEQ